jgi:GLPGLI family protein
MICIKLVVLQSAAQSWEVEYLVRFNDQFDRGRRDRLHSGHLQIRGQSSRYYTLPRTAFEAETENDIVFMPDTGNQVFTDHEQGVLLAQELDLKGEGFYVSDSLYPMSWKIGLEEKYIDSLKCVKASCEFRGRAYTAWFAPDVPLPFGPWKMGGLPGLIVELQDSGENLLVRLIGIRAGGELVFRWPQAKYSIDEHIAERRKLMQRLTDNARASATGDCPSCQQQSRVEFYLWEKIRR